MKGIGSKQRLNPKSQLCAGHIIGEKKLRVYEYKGTFKNTTFHEITKPLDFEGRLKQKVIKSSKI